MTGDGTELLANIELVEVSVAITHLNGVSPVGPQRVLYLVEVVRSCLLHGLKVAELLSGHGIPLVEEGLLLLVDWRSGTDFHF